MVAELHHRLNHLSFAALEDPFLFADIDEGLHFFYRGLTVLGFLLLLLFQSLEHVAERKEKGPEEVIEKVRRGDEMVEQCLADVVRSNGQNELPDDDDAQPHQGGEKESVNR